MDYYKNWGRIVKKTPLMINQKEILDRSKNQVTWFQSQCQIKETVV